MALRLFEEWLCRQEWLPPSRSRDTAVRSKMMIEPYKGSGPVLADGVAGQAPAFFALLS